jgi:hypothetical protein
VAALACLLAAGVSAAAAADRPFSAGTFAVEGSAGYSTSHRLPDFAELETVRGAHLFLRLGIVATDEWGPGWTRGNLELFAEPTVAFLHDGGDFTIGGLSLIVRQLYRGWGAFRPYVEGGAGVLGGDIDLPQTSCDVNYGLQAGPGALLFFGERTAVAFGYRFLHVSNARSCGRNLGLNSSLFTIGVARMAPRKR